jgi:gamma-glutamyltranspeptidase/glutathione hydrolase
MTPSRLPVLLIAFALIDGSTFAASFSPANWPADERAALERLEDRTSPEANRAVEGGNGLVAGTMSPISVRVGIDVLKQGGNAADAATVVALTQVVRSLGSFVSYAGVAQILYFDAKSGKVYSIDAGWASYLGETDPKTIPGSSSTDHDQGRKTLVPGFMAGMESLQKRFGVLPFGDLIEPAIWYAENGVTLSRSLAGYFKYREKELSRTESGRQFMHQGGNRLPAAGDKFVQTELARTLKAVAQQGAQYMYSGAWGQHYVEAVRREGGKATREDMEHYQPIWQEPLSTTFAGCTVFGPGRTSEGGYQILETLNLIEELKIDRMPPYWKDPESFLHLSRVLNVTSVIPSWMIERARTKGVALELQNRASKAFATALAPLVDDFFKSSKKNESSHHSAGIVIVDRQGNVAAIVHSINTVLWGTTGIVVDGIPVSDPAAFSQAALSTIKPGDRMPDCMIPVIATRNDKPVLAVAVTGPVLHDTVSIVLGLLGYKADAKTLMTAPPLITENGTRRVEFLIPERGYNAEFLARLRAAGATFEIVPQKAKRLRDPEVFGAIDPETDHRYSVEVSDLPAFSSAY